MKSRKTSSPVQPKKWNVKDAILHSLHALLLVATIAAHPVRHIGSVEALP
jgi:hypothetical protein